MALDHEKLSNLKSNLEEIVDKVPASDKNSEKIVNEVMDRLGFVEEIEDSRPPRLYVFGRSGAGKSSLINALANQTVTDVGDIKPTTVESEIYDISFPERYADWQVVDSRGLFESVSPDGDVPADTVSMMERDLREYRPDVLLHVITPDQARAGKDDFEAVEKLRNQLGPLFPPVIYCVNKVDTHMSPGGDWPPEDNLSLQEDIYSTLQFVADDLLEEREKEPFDRDKPYLGYQFNSETHIGAVPVCLKEGSYWNVDNISWLIGDFLPAEAKLQFFQAQQRDELMRRWARSRTWETSVGAAGVGAAPMPVADFAILTGIQLLLVAFLGAASCRDLEWSTVSDYLSAMGASSVAGVGARGLARTMIQVIPVGGTAISAGVAFGTTWAIGRSAEEYFFNDNVVKPSEFMSDGKELFREQFSREN